MFSSSPYALHCSLNCFFWNSLKCICCKLFIPWGIIFTNLLMFLLLPIVSKRAFSRNWNLASYTWYGHTCISAKLFSLVQVPIFLACTVFHPFFFAFSWEELGRLKFPCFPDSRFHSYLVIHHAQCGFAMILNGVLFLEATNLSSLFWWCFASKYCYSSCCLTFF